MTFRIWFGGVGRGGSEAGLGRCGIVVGFATPETVIRRKRSLLACDGNWIIYGIKMPYIFLLARLKHKTNYFCTYKASQIRYGGGGWGGGWVGVRTKGSHTTSYEMNFQRWSEQHLVSPSRPLFLENMLWICPENNFSLEYKFVKDGDFSNCLILIQHLQQRKRRSQPVWK